VDSIWRDYRFALTDNTADGSSAAWVVLGDRLETDDWAGIAVRLLVDGFEVAAATGAAASGHPAAGICWLAGELPRLHGTTLRAGDVVITGGLTAAHPLEEGGTITAHFDTAAASSVTVSVERAPVSDARPRPPGARTSGTAAVGLGTEDR